jgi:uncharacterized protein
MHGMDAYVPWVAVPALLLAVGARCVAFLIQARFSRLGAKMSGYAVARHLLDGAGLYHVAIERAGGEGNRYFDPRRRVLQLSPDLYYGRHVAAMGTAAHEAGHAIQDLRHPRCVWMREAARVSASVGSGLALGLTTIGLVGRLPACLAAGLLLFTVVVAWQLASLPVEWHAGRQAQRMLVRLDMVDRDQMSRVRLVLLAAALANLGATLQAIATLWQWVASRIGPRGRPT